MSNYGRSEAFHSCHALRANHFTHLNASIDFRSIHLYVYGNYDAYIRTLELTEFCMYGGMFVWRDACMEGCMYGGMHVWRDACMYGGMHVWRDACMEGCGFDKAAWPTGADADPASTLHVLGRPVLGCYRCPNRAMRVRLCLTGARHAAAMPLSWSIPGGNRHLDTMPVEPPHLTGRRAPCLG